VPVETLKAAGVIDEQGKALLNLDKDVKTVQQGAATQVWCATHPSLEGKGGVYCENADIARLAEVTPGEPFTVGRAGGAFGVKPYAVDQASASRLWKLSEDLITGVSR
jgi:hypothetical protein